MARRKGSVRGTLATSAQIEFGDLEEFLAKQESSRHSAFAFLPPQNDTK